MRLPRLIIVIAFFLTAVLLTFISLRSSHPSSSTNNLKTQHAGVRSFFSFNAPFSLFPPNAIITLTHENSTAFLARPAAFGPALPTDGLKGQVWIGSGFGDDAGAEGELGCSDVPGRVDNYKKSGAAELEGSKSADRKSATNSARLRRRSTHKDGSFSDRTAAPGDLSRAYGGDSEPPVDDGTDDYLHYPLPGSTVFKSVVPTTTDDNHADIQSIQEGAEIAGKVVLLSRGGCGFLEKVKWAQRRGAVALIVGDDTKGGPLIQMYARGDTSNVTISSVFTSRTTAHLLSSLVGSEGFIAGSVDGKGNPGLKVQHDKSRRRKKQVSKPTFTQTLAAAKATSTAKVASKAANKKMTTPTQEQSSALNTERPGWLKSLFFGSGGEKSESASSRPPSSGQLDWVLVDDWKDDDSGPRKIATPKAGKKNDKKIPQKSKSGDDFVIGVQDWRDPDLVDLSGTNDAGVKTNTDATKTKSTKSQPTRAGKKYTSGALQDIPEYVPPLRGGSITPGSGEYGGSATVQEDRTRVKEQEREPGGTSKGLLNAIFGDDEENVEFLVPASHSSNVEEILGDDDEYEGLWVTITPTSGASPFLDTLLVLVVSPLVTLTVVYALLLIRSRIRRRRWRAPKSVVERLPVRTYQTITTPGNQSPRVPNPAGSSSTSPLLQSSPSPRPRPRSRTTTGIPEPGDIDRVNSQPLRVPSPTPRRQEHEKNASVSTEWKKYMGKQVECVVCLEEYVDGVSRVMSLPCGHEFHADCITPWLTTRRRTCPICKGDVVRSLARGSPASPRYDAYHDSDSDDDIQAQAAQTVNPSSSAALPIPSSETDLEEGLSARQSPRLPNQSSTWRELLSNSLRGASRSPRPPQEDRNR
ncbi:hypothetical protein B0O99DRAFT_527254 [Bisporella sp. PMI_857]|nr:hypothetical protein B0O99DRAFT_527254 [Bisporella sp. PMI_857]